MAPLLIMWWAFFVKAPQINGNIIISRTVTLMYVNKGMTHGLFFLELWVMLQKKGTSLLVANNHSLIRMSCSVKARRREGEFKGYVPILFLS